MNKIFFLLLFYTFSYNSCFSQTNESYSQAYEFLYRIAQKGIISFDDYILPLDRTDIKTALDSTKLKEFRLSKIEKKELNFFLQEYHSDELIDTANAYNCFFKNDKGNRFRTFFFSNNVSKIYLDPIIGASYINNNNMHQFKTFGGARLYGNLNKKIGFNLFFRDVTETGDSIDITKNFTPETGVVNTSRNIKQLNYSQLNFNLGYRWKNGSLIIGKDNLNLGYGVEGKIILSSKSPSFPYIMLNYQFNKWLQFNYFNAWLNSNILDSSRSYNTNTGVYQSFREIYRSKYLAQHSVRINPIKGLDIVLGESMVYSDKLDIGYLIPINLFKLYDQYAGSYKINAGSNSQIFAQLSSRNHLKNTHIYLSFFIDEIRLSKIFDKVESRNQLAYTFGINKTDIILPYFTVGLEYTRINPFVYKNLIPAQTYENANYCLGDWMGNNADRVQIFFNYTPAPRFKINVNYQLVRKGASGTIDQQYNQQPQPSFLFNQLFQQQKISINSTIEIRNKLILFSNLQQQTINYFSPNNSKSSHLVCTFGFTYGL